MEGRRIVESADAITLKDANDSEWRPFICTSRPQQERWELPLLAKDLDVLLQIIHKHVERFA